MTCPVCSAPLTGSYCSACGTSAERPLCPSCGGTAAAGDTLCEHCGTTLVSTPAPRVHRSRGPGVMGWVVSAFLAVALVLSLALPRLGPANPVQEASSNALQGNVLAGGPGSAANVDLSSMTPREAADRLFLRVMRAAAANDVVELQSFGPMALGAYDLLEDLDSQATFRVALLQRIGGLEEESYATLNQGLSADPTHLLLLGSAAEVAISLGDESAARQYAQRFVESFELESDRDRPEYRENRPVLDNLQQRAEELLATDPT